MFTVQYNNEPQTINFLAAGCQMVFEASRYKGPLFPYACGNSGSFEIIGAKPIKPVT